MIDCTMTNTNTHGGPREGAGRNPLDPIEPTEKHTLTAPASVWRLLENVGDGVRSKGLRRVVAAYESRPAITMRPKPEVSHYGDGEPLDDGPDLRMEGGE